MMLTCLGVRVSASLGALAQLTTRDYIKDTGSILGTEDRHTSYLRSAIHGNPFPKPFDTPLSPNQAYSIFAQYIVSCPVTNPILPLRKFPLLQLDPKAPRPIKTGSQVLLMTPNDIFVPANAFGSLYAAFIIFNGPIFVPVTPIEGGFMVIIPAAVDGQTYVVLTGCNTILNDETIAAGPAIIEVSQHQRCHIEEMTSD